MKLVYFSLTGQTRRFVKKIGMESVEITPTNPFLTVDEPYLLIVPTYEREITEPVNDFLEYETNLKQCKGVIGGGNRNFADLFIYTAKDICRDYDLPLLYAFEFNGTMEDVEFMKKVVSELES
ncbi:MAG: class Ib ribonucleoside-diphosphate reductase assembly flavoprotein NrdI [Lactobacillales bacterium]|nr:class Ib ribonucleoside-diphosphate reductase assembly flavoprotein NrdI [Lactobacillales bacterium]